MKKIISLFQRKFEGDRAVWGAALVEDVVTPGAEWVIAGEGTPYRKRNGTACAILPLASGFVPCRGLFKRYDAKGGKPPPEGFIPAQEPDPVTGHWPGWVLVGTGPENKWHRDGLADRLPEILEDPEAEGTYELVGPKVQGNPYKLETHRLIKHDSEPLDYGFALNFETIRNFLRAHEFEGIVWHHPDGRMVKIKKKDFGD